jgi:hypothetical protein
MLPRVVYQMAVHGALIVGSQAKKLCGEDVDAQDYDVLVPLEKWQTVALLIPRSARPNKFGGWRFKTDFKGAMVEVDVWPDSLDKYLSQCKTKYGGKVYAVDFINNRAFSSQCIDIDAALERANRSKKRDRKKPQHRSARSGPST